MRNTNKQFSIDLWAGIGLGYEYDNVTVEFEKTVDTWKIHKIVILFTIITWKTLEKSIKINK